jgi:hypothetical protein
MSVLSDATEPVESPVTTGRPRFKSFEEYNRVHSKSACLLGCSEAETEKSNRTARAFDGAVPTEVGAREVNRRGIVDATE